jgi:hypothetical protein
MPFIKVKKPGIFGEAFLGDKAYELVEVDEQGQPIRQKQAWSPKQDFWAKQGQAPIPKQPGQMSRTYKSRTEEKIGDGIRAPDTAKGYKRPFNYHMWNKLRAMKKKRR